MNKANEKTSVRNEAIFAAEPDACAVVLAGGDGFQRNKLIPQHARFGCPRQFCRTAGKDYRVNQARMQIALAFPPEKTFFVVTEKHRRYYERALKGVPPENLIVQPQNDGTTFAVLYAALHLARRMKTTGILTFFPADFRREDAEDFMSSVKKAVEAVCAHPRLILLGDVPKKGVRSSAASSAWIEPDSSFLDESFDVRAVRAFYDLVSPEKARQLKKNGALRHSSVMVGTIATFLRKIRFAAPEIYASFHAAKRDIGTPNEAAAIQRVFYDNFAETCFSSDVLAKSADKLAVMPITRK